MKGLNFYLEYDTTGAERKRRHSGNVIAVATDPAQRCLDGSIEAIGAVFFYPNSPVAGTAVSWEYLRFQCRRIAEKEARTIHPALFERLDKDL